MNDEARAAETPARRVSALRRRTRETDIALLLDLDRPPESTDRASAVDVRTGIGFLDHLVGALAYHAGWSLALVCAGDLEIDAHHSAEDCALLLGEAFSRALAAGKAPRRFGWAFAPLDEALARAVVDISGRPGAFVELGLEGRRLGALEAEDASHFISSLATAAKMTVHVDLIRGENAHHCAEAAFKALALALRDACSVEGTSAKEPGGSPGAVGGMASTKGSVGMEELDAATFEAAVSAIARSRRGGGAEATK